MHKNELKNKSRLCVGEVGKDTEKHNLGNVWININLNEQVKDAFATEYKTKFQKLISKASFNTKYRHKDPGALLASQGIPKSML